MNISEDRLKHFMALLSDMFYQKRVELLEIPKVRTLFAKAERSFPFSDAEIDACIEKMVEDNRLSLRSGDTIYK